MTQNGVPKGTRIKVTKNTARWEAIRQPIEYRYRSVNTRHTKGARVDRQTSDMGIRDAHGDKGRYPMRYHFRPGHFERYWRSTRHRSLPKNPTGLIAISDRKEAS